MAYDFCLGCGVLLAPYVYSCPICGFENGYGEDDDFEAADDFLIDSGRDYHSDPDYE